MRKKLQFLLGILISIFFLYLALHKVDFQKFWQGVRGADYFYVILAMLMALGALSTRSLRWKFLLGFPKGLKVGSCFSATCVGLMTNNILPFRVGDLAQAYFLGRREKISKSRVFSTVVLERVIDLSTMLLVLGISSFFSKRSLEVNRFTPDGFTVKGMGIILTVCIIAIGGIILCVWKSQLIESIFLRLGKRFFPNWAPRLTQLLGSFLAGFGNIKQSKFLLPSIALSFLLWLIYGFAMFVAMLSFGIKAPVVAGIITNCITVISVMIPSSPGYIGTWEFFGVTALGFFGIEKSLAFSCIFVYHMIQYFPIVALGLFFLAREGISLREIEKPNS